MSSLDEEVYSTIFNALRHGVRRKILRMLSAEHLSFTSISERLGITSPHLTYHLEALGELISKNDSKYRLSVFGKAAVNMMASVEDAPRPPRLIDRDRIYKALMATLCIFVLIFAGLYLDLSNKYSAQSIDLRSRSLELEDLNAKFMQIKSIMNLAYKFPHSYYVKGIDIVSGYNINYEHNIIDSNYDIIPRDFYMVFYAPQANLTLRMFPWIYYPLGDFTIPLTLQKGNALLNESGVSVIEEEHNITFWQSPVIWSMNASSTMAYDVVLPSEGWYTLCITGPISRLSGGGTIFRSLIFTAVNGTIQRFDYAKAWVDFKLLKDGEPILFAVSSQ